MLLFVGPGNPGAKYAHNRHNIGFMAIEEIARRHGPAPWRRRFQGETAEGTLDGERVVPLPPRHVHGRIGARGSGNRDFFKLGSTRSPYFRMNSNCRRQGPHQDRRRHRRPQRPAFDLRASRQRLSPGTARIGHPGVKELVHGHVLSDFAKSNQPWVKSTVQSQLPIVPGCWWRAATRRSRTRCIC